MWGPATQNDIVPTYDYVCQDCGETFEIRASISEYSKGVKPRCTRCGSERAVRAFGSVTVLTASRGGGGKRKGCKGSCPPTCSC